MAAEQLNSLLEQACCPSPITLGEPKRCPDQTRFLVAFELIV
jgi:hypothetical protein